MLEMMDEIDVFCKDNGISYFLIGGTLLGAVRHKGFIPWDDDMDIGMFRHDYEFFIQNFQSSSGNVSVNNFKTKKKYIWPAAKVTDDRTLLYETRDKRIESGVFIDVFPFDGIEGKYSDAVKIVRRSNLWNKALTLKHLSITPKRSIIKNVIVILGRILYLIPDDVMIRRINYGLHNYVDLSECQYICNFAGAWGIREITRIENFKGIINAAFEDRIYKIPVGYDDYLKTVYGDYMTLPPEEKRKSSHISEAYWRNT